MLKFDIEGIEHEVISDLIDSRIYPDQVLFEFDQPVPPWTVERTLNRILKQNYIVRDIYNLNILLERGF